MTRLFVTGTDTDVGKTVISAALINLLRQKSQQVVGMKPVASGCILTPEGLRNDDALTLIAQSNVTAPYDWVNPYAFEPAIAPHIAAKQVNMTINLDVIHESFIQLDSLSDNIIVEGAGGWFVPLNEQDTVADLAIQLRLPVILVVGVRLGCINHALLSVDAIARSGLPLAGWVANQVAACTEAEAIIESLKTRIAAPCLGVIPTLDETKHVPSLRLPI